MHYRRIIGIIFAAMLVAIILQIPLHRRSAIRTWPMAAKSDPIPATVRSLRPVYPYSVIPGGVYSTEELKRAMFKDPMVREHYAGFDLAAAHLVTTAGERYAYVSYRMGGKLLWTTHKLRIPKGETLLTDGVTFCRTRCGNQLSEFPHRETASPEPPLRSTESSELHAVIAGRQFGLAGSTSGGKRHGSPRVRSAIDAGSALLHRDRPGIAIPSSPGPVVHGIADSRTNTGVVS